MAANTQDVINNLIGQLPEKARGRFLEAINQNQTSLDLSNCGLTAKDMVVTADLLPFTAITTINVAGNRIGDKGVIALSNNKTLTSLDVGQNTIGAEGATALSNNTTLTTLNVASNKIGDEGAIALLNNTTLTTLNVGCNKIGHEGQRVIKEMVENNRQNLTDFKNEASSIGQGLRDIDSHWILPAKVSELVVAQLAEAHGFFASPKVMKEARRNLYPACKDTGQVEQVTYG